VSRTELTYGGAHRFNLQLEDSGISHSDTTEASLTQEAHVSNP